MSKLSTKLLPQIKKTLRETSTDFDEEISSYIDACATDLMDAGILPSFFSASDSDWECDSRILQAIRWYCLSVYGLYNADMEKYVTAYNSLKSTLCAQSKYTEVSDGV